MVESLCQSGLVTKVLQPQSNVSSHFIIKTPEQIVLVFPLLTLNKLITAGTGLYISKNDLPEN